MPRTFLAALLSSILIAGCGAGDDGGASGQGQGRSALGEFEFPPAPATPDGPPDAAAGAAADEAIRSLTLGALDRGAVEQLAASGDPRQGWLVADMLRFAQSGAEQRELLGAFTKLTDVDPSADPSFSESPWLSVTNHLIAWDLAAPAGYQQRKGDLFTALEPGWAPFFGDSGARIDWRLLSWGGVLIDDRPGGAQAPCERGCIPALDDPELTAADRGDWYPDDRIVFGIEIGGEAVALPRNIMEVHEMVNMNLGGRRLGIPYCTLCGSAQAYLTDRNGSGGMPLVLRTSGLLSRSNKVMYELGTESVLDTFTGEALSGPLRERGVELEQVSVVATSWGEWKAEHPDTRIIARDGGIGRDYPLDPLGGRDDDGPIFPIGPVDDRLPAQEKVVGVITDDGKEVAFAVEDASGALAADDQVEIDGVILENAAGGFTARDREGVQLPTHEAFWFAWSQFHPQTELWTAG